MSAPSFVCAGAEIALNRYLRLESSVLEECAQLSGRVIEIEITTTAMSLAVEFTPGGVRVMPESPQTPDVRISGGATALLAAMKKNDAESASLPANLDVQGDVELLMRFQAMIERVGFDPEEWLAPMLGGPAAHRIVGGLKQMFGWGRDNSRRMADHTAEYLREESYDLARSRDVESWINEVEQARDSVERLDARLRRLEKNQASAI